MKTKEQILKEATKRTLNINEGSPLHDAVMKAMEEYAQEQVKLFCQPVVIPSCEGNCGINYCDDNGCIERKRILVEPKDLPEHEV
jgi:hypothetical protein